MKTELTTETTTGNKRSLLRDQRGAGLVEYAMIAGLVAIAAITAFGTFGTSVSGKVTNQATTVGTAIPEQ